MANLDYRRLISIRYAFSFFLLFMLATLLAPAFFINKLIFFIICTWLFVLLASGHFPRKILITSPFFIFFIFLYGYGLSLLNPNDHELANQLLLSSFVLFLIYFVRYYDLDIDRATEICGKIMVGVTLLYGFLFFISDANGVKDLIFLVNDISQSASAERDYLGDDAVLTIALGSAPFLYLPWCLILMRLSQKIRWNDFIWAMIYAFVIVLSGARGIMVISVAFMCYIFIFNRPSILSRFFVFLIALILFVSSVLFLIFNTMVFGGEETSNAVKIGHLRSFFEQLTWARGFFGDGLGSYYFSSGSGILKSHTELTPVDLVRYVGFPLAFMIYTLLLFPRLYRDILGRRRQPILVAFSLYLVLSITNPVLFNSIGMLVVIWYWNRILRI